MSESSYLSTAISYFQGLGMGAGSSDMNLPKPLSTIMGSVLHAFELVADSIPLIPAFDPRTRLAILGVGVPTLVYTLVIWFMFSTFEFLISVLDVAAVGLGSGFLAWGFAPNHSLSEAFHHVQVAFMVGICGLYLLIRMFVKIGQKCREPKEVLKYRDAAREVCRYFLYNFCPEIQVNITPAELQTVLRSQQVEPLTPEGQKMSCLGTFVRLLVVGVLVTGGCYVLGAFTIPGVTVGPMYVILAYFAFPIAAFLVIRMLMGHTECGRRGLVKIREFGRRWGLRLLLLVLDIAYIPTIEALITLLVYTRNAPCPGLSVYTYSNVSSGIGFVELNGWCSPCLGDACTGVCAQEEGLWLRREAGETPLSYVKDVLSVTGPMEAYVVFCVLLGLPVLWGLLIRDNSAFLWEVKVWGADMDSKWRALLERMKSNGLTMFADYRHEWKTWAIWLLLFKFLLMLLATVAKYVESAAFALPCLYVAWLVFTAIQRPYLFKFNTLIDCLLYGFNAVFLVIPLIAHRVPVPSVAKVVVAICCLALPVVGVIVLLVWRLLNKKAERDDVTIPRPLEEAELAYRQDNFQDERKRWIAERFKADHDDAARRRRLKLIEGDGVVYDAVKAENCFDWDDLDAAARRGRTDVKILGDQSQFFRDRDTDEVEFHMLDSMEECEEASPAPSKSRRSVQVEALTDSDDDELLSSAPKEHAPETYKVNRLKLAATCKKLYLELDAVVDVSTMRRTATMLGGAVLIGMLTGGWWLGWVLAKGSELRAQVEGFPLCAVV